MVPLWDPVTPGPSGWRHPGCLPPTVKVWGTGVQGLTGCLAAGLVCVMGLWGPRRRRHALEQENRKVVGLVGSRGAGGPSTPVYFLQGAPPQAPLVLPKPSSPSGLDEFPGGPATSTHRSLMGLSLPQLCGPLQVPACVGSGPDSGHQPTPPPPPMTSGLLLTSSSLYQDRFSAVSTNQYSLEPPFMMPILLIVSQPFRMTWGVRGQEVRGQRPRSPLEWGRQRGIPQKPTLPQPLEVWLSQGGWGPDLPWLEPQVNRVEDGGRQRSAQDKEASACQSHPSRGLVALEGDELPAAKKCASGVFSGRLGKTTLSIFST